MLIGFSDARLHWDRITVGATAAATIAAPIAPRTTTSRTIRAAATRGRLERRLPARRRRRFRAAAATSA
jgi:hypothetical protein